MTIRDQVQLMLASSGDVPTGITFSQDGYMRAVMEDDACAVTFREGGAPSYLGLEVTISETLQGVFQLDYGRKPTAPISITMPYGPGGVNVMELAGSCMTAADLCDIIQGFLSSDDPGAWGPFEKALDRVVKEHGRFE